ncbi:MAG: helix-turn-helix transcriptional regulator [Flavobacterium sp.]|nr:helix-turn-helix transcriptional regulator [Flavobacterium sp.]
MKTFPVYSVDHFSCQNANGELYANTFREHLKTHSFIEQSHRHDSHLLVFFTHGSGNHEIDFDVYPVSRGTMFVLQPGQMHNWELSADIEGFIVIFSAALYNLYFGEKQLEDYPFYAMQNTNPQIKFPDEATKNLLQYFNQMIEIASKNRAYHQDLTLNLLDCIHMEAATYFPDQPHTFHAYNHKIKQFTQLLEHYFKTKKSASFYASKLSITIKHLNRICRETLEKTATQVIAERIVLEVKRQLMNPNLSVNQIADSVGFEDYSYFTRFFKKNTGVTPVKFRTLKNKQA